MWHTIPPGPIILQQGSGHFKGREAPIIATFKSSEFLYFRGLCLLLFSILRLAGGRSVCRLIVGLGALSKNTKPHAGPMHKTLKAEALQP